MTRSPANAATPRCGCATGGRTCGCGSAGRASIGAGHEPLRNVWHFMYNHAMAYARNHRGTLAERFWRKVDKSGDCWEWTGARGNSTGHGRIRDQGASKWSHRVSWELTHGPIPKGMFVCHACDNPPCVRPSHLFLGSAKDNSEDMVRKHRQVFGMKTTGVRLNEDKVREIRTLANDGMPSAALAEQFGVGYVTIRDIITRKTWRHVT